MVTIKTLAIIGGGASGLMAAIAAARTAEKGKGKINIVILERMNRVGRKIPATGNGRCNFTNRNADPENYFGEEPLFVREALSVFGVNKTLDFFEGLGIFPKEEEKGKIYPYSDQATAVLDGLRSECQRLGVVMKTGFDVKEVKSRGGRFYILSYNNESLTADGVIFACGGCASPDLGSNGSGFKLLERLGHSITELSPALVQIRLKADFLKSLSGIKVRGVISLSEKGNIIREEEGEILFTAYGVSGPPVFSLSGFVRGHKRCSVIIDFMPGYELDEVYRLLSVRAQNLKSMTMEMFFSGLFHKRIGNVITRKAGIEKLSFPVKKLKKEDLWVMAELIKGFEMEVMGLNGWNNAQVTAGGAMTKEFDPNTMESRKVKGLYCCGEILDIYGECGGYNLQWAWSSGYLAGTMAARGLLE